MNTEILHKDESAEFYTEERCYILELSNSAEDEVVSIARARVLPGVATRWHVLRGTVERYVIQSGCGRVEVGDLAATDVRAGDVVRIPAERRQRITNTGADDLVFLAICTPRFRAKNYVDVDEEPRSEE